MNHGFGPWEIACEGNDVGVFGAEGLGVDEGATFGIVRRKRVRGIADGERPVYGLRRRDAVGLVEGIGEVEFEDLAGVDEQGAPAGGAFGFGGIGVEALRPFGDVRGKAVPGNCISVDG